MECTITAIKCFTAKYWIKVVITINFKGQAVDIFAPKQFYFTAADFEKKFKKLDKGMILKAIEIKGEDNYYLDIDIELSAKY